MLLKFYGACHILFECVSCGPFECLIEKKDFFGVEKTTSSLRISENLAQDTLFSEEMDVANFNMSQTENLPKSKLDFEARKVIILAILYRQLIKKFLIDACGRPEAVVRRFTFVSRGLTSHLRGSSFYSF